MKTLLVAFGLFLFLIPVSSYADEMRVSKYVRVYKGDEGLKVTMALVEPSSKKQALILTEGIESPFDGVVQLHSVAEEGRVYYRTTYNGSSWNTLTAESDWGWKHYTVYLPEVKDSADIWYDEKLSQQTSSEALLKRYRDRANQDRIRKLSTFDRKGLVATQEASLKQDVASTNLKCGTSLSAAIDWGTVSDEIAKQYSISSFCGGPLEAMRSFCEDEKNKGELRKRVKKLKCKFGKKLNVGLDQDALAFTTSVEAANQPDFVKAYLDNTLAQQ